MRRTAVSFGLLLLGACAPRVAATPPPPPRPLTLSIISTNDIHGQLERLPVVAGFVHDLRDARAKDGGVLLVDAGDAFQGTIESNLNEGAAVISAFGAMGYAAFALGNHEFDFGPVGPASIPLAPGDDPQGALEQRIAEARFPVLAANLVTASGQTPAWKNLSRSTEVVAAGVKVGIVGLLTMDAPDVVKRPVFAGLRVTPLADAAIREARALRARGASVVILVAHAGGECARVSDPRDLSSCDPDSEIFRLARALPPGLVDAIFGGHKDAAVAQFVAGIPIVHVPSHLVAFSRVDLSIDGATGKVLGATVSPPHPVCAAERDDRCDPGVYEGRPVIPDEATRAALQPALAAARERRDQSLGVRVESDFPAKRGDETALGNLFADLMREAAKDAEIAIGNAGSVRDVLPRGELTFGRLHHVMPFDNQLARLRLSGKDLRALVAANLTTGEHGMLAVSGMTVDAACNGPSLEVTLKHPGGTAVRDDEPVTVATNDFLALGGDGLLAAAHLDVKPDIDSRQTILQALIDGLGRRHAIRADDPTLFDPEHPRVKLPGPFPVRCSAAR